MIRYLVCLVAISAYQQVATAQNYTLQSHSISSGSGQVSGSAYSLRPNIGQPFVGKTSSSAYTLTAGILPTVIPRQAELTLLNLKVTPDEIPPGNTASLTFTVTNTGAVAIFGVISAKVYLSVNEFFEPGDILLDEFDITTDLDPGQTLAFPTGSSTKNIPIPDTTTLGSYNILVALETDGPINEINPNNVFAIPVDVLIATGGVDVDPPSITITASDFRTTTPIRVTITDDSDIAEAKLGYRQVSAISFTEVVLVNTAGNNFEITPEDNWADEIGMEVYVWAEDVVGNRDTTENSTLFYRAVDPEVPVPFEGNFDGSTSTYQMFSIPYVPEDRSIVNLFNELGGYDKTRWRIFTYVNDRYVELLEGINNVELGRGYWFNTIEDTAIVIGAGDIQAVDQENPFTKNFTQGWNQIGCPYPFDVNWSQVQAANPEAGLNSLKIFRNGKYDNSVTLSPWDGGFVFSDNGGTVTFPIGTGSGRIDAGKVAWKTPDDDFWQLELKLEQGTMSHRSAIGMHPNASPSKDKFDEMTVPRFIEYLEMNSMHPEFFDPYFSHDVVPTTPSYEWTFTLSTSDPGNKALLRWDQNMLLGLESSMVLMDMQSLDVVDMQQLSEYRISNPDGKEIRIFYDRTGEFNPGFTAVGSAYPNPFTGSVRIPVYVDHPDEVISLTFFDASGREVYVLTQNFSSTGVHHLEWDGKAKGGQMVSSGLLFYRMDEKDAKTQRLIKR